MSEDSADLESKRRRARKLRRAGYIVIAVASAYLTIPMLVGAFGGAARGELWDPYTGERWAPRSETEAACYDEARRLIAEASTLAKLTRQWDDTATEWQTKCRKDHPDLYRLVTETRADLIERGKKKR